VRQKIDESIRAQVLKEPYAIKMGLTLRHVDEGYALVEMVFTSEMANIFGMVHGGAIFSLIDEAFEIASNSHGTSAVALNMNVTYISAPAIGDTVKAEAKEVSRTRRTATYAITVNDAGGHLLATCNALVYRKEVPLPFL
jgi:acyl-CoA thioesterase